jgi:N-glycosylase/DNA lyase
MKTNCLSLDHSLGCGQAFRWHKHGDAWHGVVSGKAIELRQDGKELLVSGCSDRFAERYLSLDADYNALRRKAQKDPVLTKAMDAFPGLRVLRQDPWETLISYMCSSNNSIPNITRCVERIAEEYGSKAEGAFDAFAFPTPEQMDGVTEKQLRKLSLGFRAEFVRDAVGLVNDGWDLYGLAKLGYDRAKAELITLDGVGEKIADCVCLFAFGFGEAVPVDVWTRRAFREYYKCRDDAHIRAFARERFGAYAGWVQEFLYHYRRMKG